MSSKPSNISPAPFVLENVIVQVMAATLPTDTAAAASAAAANRLGILFDLRHSRPFRLARRLSRNAEEARDLVQETLLRAVIRVLADVSK